MRFVYLIHDPSWTASRVTDLLRHRGHEVEYLCHQHGDELPSPSHFGDAYHGLIIGGGLTGVDAAATEPFMAAEIRLTRDVVDAGHRFLGLCLGAQVLGAAYGAPVGPRPDHRAEFGFTAVHPTPAGADLFDDPTIVFQVHDEGILDLPPQAELLASSSEFPVQAFRVGPAAYGLQFHPDAAGDHIQSWWHDNQRLHDRTGSHSLSRQLTDARKYEADRVAWLNQFLDRWLAPLPSEQAQRH